MFNYLRTIFLGPNGIQTGPTAENPITPEQVLASLHNLPSGSSIANLLIENGMDCSLYAYAPLIAAERFITESIATLPCLVYKKDGEEGKDRASEHPVFELLRNSPNNYQVPFNFYKTILQNAIRFGNAYVLIERNGAGEPANLVILDSKYCKVCFEGGIKFFKYESPGLSGTISNSDVIHILGFTNDGIIGTPLISYAQKVIKLGLAVEQYAQKFFTNGTASRGIIKLPATITDEQYQQLVSSWKLAYTGAEGAWTTPVLAYGAEWVDTNVPNNESQLIELRKYQLLETARLMRVSPYVLQHYENGGTYQNIEAAGIDLVKNCLQHWISQLEQEFTCKLFSKEERQTYFVEFLIDARLRGDTKSRYEAYQIGRNGGWLSINDIRRMENQPDVEGGDSYQTTPMGGSPNPTKPSGNDSKASESPEDPTTGDTAENPAEDVADKPGRSQINVALEQVATEAAKAIGKKKGKK